MLHKIIIKIYVCLELTSSCILLFKGVSCEPGEVVFGCVLDWDFDKKLVVVSLAPELVAERKAVEAHKRKQKKVELLKIVLTKLGNTKVLDIRSVTSHTAVTCVVTQHSLKVVFMLHACRFCRTFFFSSLDCWQSVFLSKFSEEY